MAPVLTHITFSGGGMHGLVYLGVLKYLYMENLHSSVKTVAGTSIGAIMGCILCLGIHNFEEHFYKSIHSLKLPGSDLMNIFTKDKYGIANPIHIVTGLINAMKAHGYDHEMTFLDLAKKTGRNLLVSATCIETSKATYFSVDTTPNVRVVDAIKASCAIPLIFHPVQIGEYHYVDGCFTDNFPVKQCIQQSTTHESLIVGIESSIVNATSPLDSFPAYLSHFVGYMIRNNVTDQENKLHKHRIICKNPCLNIFPIQASKDGIRLNLTKEDVEKAIVQGIELTHEWFMSLTPPSP